MVTLHFLEMSLVIQIIPITVATLAQVEQAGSSECITLFGNVFHCPNRPCPDYGNALGGAIEHDSSYIGMDIDSVNERDGGFISNTTVSRIAFLYSIIEVMCIAESS